MGHPLPGFGREIIPAGSRNGKGPWSESAIRRGCELPECAGYGDACGEEGLAGRSREGGLVREGPVEEGLAVAEGDPGVGEEDHEDPSRSPLGHADQ